MDQASTACTGSEEYVTESQGARLFARFCVSWRVEGPVSTDTARGAVGRSIEEVIRTDKTNRTPMFEELNPPGSSESRRVRLESTGGE